MTAKASNTEQELSSIRDTVESIWIAIVLAFVLRAFMIEAFVIPTGSMAPRLMGEHWDLTCPSCGYDYAFGYSPPATMQKQSPNRGEKINPVGNRCPNCGNTDSIKEYVNGGDRVLVLKYLYQFHPPEPWDVVVFKNPQNNRENYIKRLIGLPGETIEIVHGDIYYKASDEAPWQIRRKPQGAQEAMWQIVFDNDYRPSEESSAPKWDGVVERWDRRQGGRVFVLRGGGHDAQLKLIADRRDFLPVYGYNASHAESPSNISNEVDVCTDLNLSVVMFPATADAGVTLLLTSLEHEFTGLVKADGTVVLSHRPVNGGPPEEWGRAQLPPLPLGRGTQVALTHVDYRVTLRVNGKAVLETTDQQYKPDVDALRRRVLEAGLDRTHDWLDGMGDEAVKATLLRLEPTLVRHWMASALPEIADAAAKDPQVMRMWLKETPAGQIADKLRHARTGAGGRAISAPEVRIVAQGEGLELHHLKLMRDVYYTSPSLDRREEGPEGKYASVVRARVGMPGWGATGNPIRLARNDQNPDLDEFYVLGDNSPQSLDGRLWVKAAPTLKLFDEHKQPLYSLGTVPRYNMIGKAFFVYWPAGFRVPGLPRLAIIPNVGKMRLIR